MDLWSHENKAITLVNKRARSCFSWTWKQNYAPHQIRARSNPFSHSSTVMFPLNMRARSYPTSTWEKCLQGYVPPQHTSNVMAFSTWEQNRIPTHMLSRSCPPQHATKLTSFNHHALMSTLFEVTAHVNIIMHIPQLPCARPTISRREQECELWIRKWRIWGWTFEDYQCEKVPWNRRIIWSSKDSNSCTSTRPCIFLLDILCWASML